jgi:hypothetical protein
MMQKVLLSLQVFVLKIATFTTILRVKKCHFHYDMQQIVFITLNLVSLSGKNPKTYQFIFNHATFR